jgi:hypothetical protein
MTSNDDTPPEATMADIGRLARLLQETAAQHDHFEKASSPHDWWDWYAPYLDARLNDRDGEEATAAADLYMKDTHGIART